MVKDIITRVSISRLRVEPISRHVLCVQRYRLGAPMFVFFVYRLKLRNMGT